MNTKTIAAALAAFVLLPAAAQSAAYTPTEREAKKARANASRDQKLADSMEKARLKEEAKPVAAYIPKEEAPAQIKHHQPEVFTAGVPVPGSAGLGWASFFWQAVRARAAIAAAASRVCRAMVRRLRSLGMRSERPRASPRSAEQRMAAQPGGKTRPSRPEQAGRLPTRGVAEDLLRLVGLDGR